MRFFPNGVICILYTFNRYATENRGAPDVYRFLLILGDVLDKPPVVYFPEYGYHFRVDFPVCRNDDFSAGKQLEDVYYYGGLDISLYQIDIRAAKNVYDFTATEVFRNYDFPDFAENRC